LNIPASSAYSTSPDASHFVGLAGKFFGKGAR
jgi:hypothetical protein